MKNFFRFLSFLLHTLPIFAAIELKDTIMLSQKIIETAAELFTQNGIKAVSMDNIAQGVGISKRTLYEHFSSKDELLTQCLIFGYENENAHHIQIVSECNDFVEIIVNILFDILKDYRKTNPLFFQDLTRYHFRTAHSIFDEKEESRRNGFVELLKRGINEGYVKPDININLTIDLIMNNGTAMENYSFIAKYSFADIFTNVFIMVFRGISTNKGIEKIDKMLTEEHDKFTI